MELDRPLHIAYLALPHELAAQEWMDFFRGRGHRISLITRAGVASPSGLDSRVEIHRLPPARPVVGGRLTVFDARRAIRQVLVEIKPDVIHVHDLTTGLGWLARISGFHPYVVTTWGSDLFRLIPATRESRLIGRLILGGADLVTVNSRHMSATAVASGARPERVVEIQFGVDFDAFRPMNPDPDLQASLGLQGHRIILSPRQVAPLYDHRSVVLALAGLPADVALVMSRKNAHPDYLAELLEIASANGMSSRIRVVDEIPHDEMPRYLALADVVVSVPQSDATAVTLLEALACCRPVVISDLPSPREWLDSIWPDLIVPVRDPQALSAALLRALSMPPEEVRERAAVGRDSIARRADRRTNMLRMEELYRRTAGRLEAVPA